MTCYIWLYLTIDIYHFQHLSAAFTRPSPASISCKIELAFSSMLLAIIIIIIIIIICTINDSTSATNHHPTKKNNNSNNITTTMKQQPTTTTPETQLLPQPCSRFCRFACFVVGPSHGRMKGRYIEEALLTLGKRKVGSNHLDLTTLDYGTDYQFAVDESGGK